MYCMYIFSDCEILWTPKTVLPAPSFPRDRLHSTHINHCYLITFGSIFLVFILALRIHDKKFNINYIFILLSEGFVEGVLSRNACVSSWGYRLQLFDCCLPWCKTAGFCRGKTDVRIWRQPSVHVPCQLLLYPGHIGARFI